MSDGASNPPEADPRARFLDLFQASLDGNTFVKLVLATYRGPEPGLRRVQVKRVAVKGQQCLSFNTEYQSKAVTRNADVAAGVRSISELLGDHFLSAHLFSLTEDAQVGFSRKGTCTLSCSAPTMRARPSDQHDREKERFIDSAKPFLTALGVTDDQHRVLPSMSRKWKQINKFLEIFQHAFTGSRLADTAAVRVVDFGSGKGYLTFAIHDFLQDTLRREAHVTGIELREDLVRFCNAAASTLAINRLQFRQGDVGSYAPEAIDVMIALHACDIATDLAIHTGIRAGAGIIMCAPCCHKQIRPQIRSPEVMAPMLRFGVHLGQEAEMITDTLRALLLEAHGYSTQIIEFISLEHTSKNKMLLAVRHARKVDRGALLDAIAPFKAFYGIQEHHLETLLNTPGGGGTGTAGLAPSDG